MNGLYKGVTKLLLPVVVLAFFLGVIANPYSFVEADQETCPNGGGWTKVDSSDWHPVEGATEYCFKAGNWIDYTYPPVEFGQEGSCTEAIQYCELSHWSYFMETVLTSTPTPTSTPRPTLAPTSTPTPTSTPRPTLAPTSTPTPTLTSTLTPTPTVSPTPTLTGTVTPTPTTAPTLAPTDTPSVGGPGDPEPPVNTDSTDGQVLGTSTLGSAGVFIENLFNLMIALGIFLMALGVYKTFNKPDLLAITLVIDY